MPSVFDGPRTRWTFLSVRLSILSVLCGLGLTLPWFSAWLEDSDSSLAWPIDLASHWQWLYAAGLGISAATLAGLQRRWRWLTAAVLAAFWPWFVATAPAARAERNAPDFLIAVANVHFGNADIAPLRALLERERPDAAILVEVSPAYAAGLRTMTDYPYQTIEAEDTPFGVALLSRHPLGQSKTIRDEEAIAHIEAQLQTPAGPVLLIAFHPMPPLSAHYHRARNAQLRALARRANESGIPAIVAGDFNATPWSSAFRIADQEGLKRATGLRPTWPAVGGGILGIPIDHALVTRHWRAVDQRLGPDVGSDHRPVLARLRLAPE